MSAPIKDERRIVPRWRDSLTTVVTGELAPITSAETLAPAEDFLSSKLLDWRRNPTVAFASDLVGAALVLGQLDEVSEAVTFLNENSQLVSVPVRRLVRKILGIEAVAAEETQAADEQVELSLEDSRKAVRVARARLRDEPRNAVLWVDMGRHYAILGLTGQAIRAMGIAVKLAGDNRFTLRSAARLHVHVRDPERAHDLLRTREVTRHDPWLMAAEIAVATVGGKTSGLLRKARRLLESAAYESRHLSELASAVATVELSAGNSRGARKLFRQALIDPTDNAVAQAAWAVSKLVEFQLEPQHLETPRSFEARAWEHYRSDRWPESLAECRRWLNDEPFSTRPAVVGSFVSAVILEDYVMSEEFARRGLIANPRDSRLLNNLVFALASAGSMQAAAEEYRKINGAALDEIARIVWLANGGLIAFRHGDLEQGRFFYRKAIETAGSLGKLDYRAAAAAYWAREELAARTVRVREALEFAANELERGLKQADAAWHGSLEVLVGRVRAWMDGMADSGRDAAGST